MVLGWDFICNVCLHGHFESDRVQGWAALCRYCKTGDADPKGLALHDPEPEPEDQAQPEDSSDS